MSEKRVCPFGDDWTGDEEIKIEDPCPVCGMTGEFGAEMKCIDIVTDSDKIIVYDELKKKGII